MTIARSALAGAKAAVGPRLTVLARCVLRGLAVPRWGNLRRVRPFSEVFGFDRGTPLDRFYLHRFLDANRAAITGRVLEVQVASYTRRYGHDVETSHTVDINPRFAATYTCDLVDASAIPSGAYDCVLLPNTLQYVADLPAALRTLLRIVGPDGDELWHHTPAGWRRTLSAAWPGCEIEVEGHGNCLAAVAAMHGLALEELTDDELLADDPRFPVLVTIRCRKG